MLTESGLLYLKSGQTQLAFERLSSALALDPTCSRALLGVGCITQVFISDTQYMLLLSISFLHSYWFVPITNLYVFLNAAKVNTSLP